MRTKTTLIGIVAATLLAACGGASSGESITSPASTPAVSSASPTESPSPSPTATILTKEAAAAYYLEIVCPSNAAADALESAIFGKKQSVVFANLTAKQIRNIRKAAAKAASTARAFAAGLDEPPLPWPENVQKSVNKLVDEMLSQVTKYQSYADDKTGAQVEQSYNIRTKDSGAAQLIRLRLDLPAAGKGCPKA